jgi:hypothetical protein
MLFSFQNIILDEGEQYAGLLYSWRSLSRAVPAVRVVACGIINALASYLATSEASVYV